MRSVSVRDTESEDDIEDTAHKRNNWLLSQF